MGWNLCLKNENGCGNMEGMKEGRFWRGNGMLWSIFCVLILIIVGLSVGLGVVITNNRMTVEGSVEVINQDI